MQSPPTPPDRPHVDASVVCARRRRGVEEFGKLLEQEDDDNLDVLRCALWIAQHRNAELDVELCIRQMDELVRIHLPIFFRHGTRSTPLNASGACRESKTANERAREPTRTFIG